MILSTKGIVLHCMDYSETSVIAKIYTEQLGLQSYIAKGIRKKGSRIKKNLFAPLSILQLVANHKEGEGLRVIRDASCAYHINGIASNINKTAVSFYMSELLSRAISVQMADKELFEILENAIMMLDHTQESVAGFPLYITLTLAQHLGLNPRNNYTVNNQVFDLMEGGFFHQAPDHPYYITPPLSVSLSETLRAIDSGIIFLKTPHAVRTELLSAVLTYFRLHLTGFGELKSLQVLTDVLRD